MANTADSIPLTLITLPTVLVLHILSFVQAPDDANWMMFYARLCLVSKSWSSIAAERMAKVSNLEIENATDRAFAPLAILLRHCGAPHLLHLRLKLISHDPEVPAAHPPSIYVQAILEQIAAGRAPKLSYLEFHGLTFDTACISAFNNAMGQGYFAKVEMLHLYKCQFSAHGGAGMFMESLAEHSAQLPRLRSFGWNDMASDASSFIRGLQRGACPLLSHLCLISSLINEQTMEEVCAALTFGTGSVAPCITTLGALTLHSFGDDSNYLFPMWFVLCVSLMDPNFAPNLKRLDMGYNTFSPEVRMQVRTALETRREKMGAAFCLNEVKMG